MTMNLLERLSEDFPLTQREMLLLLVTAPVRYKVHMIEKRNNRGQREIAQPTSEIKTLQRWAIDHYLSKLPVHSAATAYRKKKSIKDHALIHSGNAYLLKLDFRDFFPSIRGADFRTHLDTYAPHLGQDAELLTKLLFWAGKPKGELRLSIGAPSSPAISNTIMYPFDQTLNGYCVEIGAKYTRYADDIAISTDKPHLLDQVFDYVSNLCKSVEYPRLILNEEKTVFTSKKRRRQLTGLVLTNEGGISLGRDRKRVIRSMAHHYEVGKLQADEINRLRGLIAFAASVEPHFIESIIRMLGHNTFNCLLRGQKQAAPDESNK